MVLFLFLTHLGFGIVFTLVFVPREAGVKFFRFNAGLAAILLLIALGLSVRARFQTHAAFVVSPGPAEGAGLGFVAHLASTAAIITYWATVGRLMARIRPALLGVAAGGGLAAIAAQALPIGPPSGMAALSVASFLTSAALLGTSCTAMILGHWYLVIPSMQVAFLQSIVRLHIAATAARIAVVAVVVCYAIAIGFSPRPGFVPSFRHYVTSIDGIFVWQRVLFGLGGPAVLSYLTWETAKIRSTQSATGILYVDFFTVVVGEALAKYVLLATHVPV